MTIARARQLCLSETCYYHCVSRCVRRAFLCGKDRFTGRDFSHRRQWIENRIARLSEIFAIEILAFAVMSNHFHVVLRVAPTRSASWSDEEVIDRWGKLCHINDEAPTQAVVSNWRQRLTSISWYMRFINEPLARMANREDGCVGRFWQGRFKLQALLDEEAVLKCMAYVDLNPVRAGVSSTPEKSLHTSIKARAEGRGRYLVPFKSDRCSSTGSLDLSQAEYLGLLRWTADNMQKNPTRSTEDLALPGHLQLTPCAWLSEIKSFGRRYFRAVGSLPALERYRRHLDVKWLRIAPASSLPA